MRKPLRILLVDDSLLFLDALTTMLRPYPYVTIVGCVRSGREALAQLPHLQPEVIVMDIAMPDMNGLEATCHITALPCAPVVVILTMEDNAEYRSAAAAAGASGLVGKAHCEDDLPPLLERVLSEVRDASQRAITQEHVGAER